MSSVKNRDGLDFDQESRLGQTLDHDEGARRVRWLGKELVSSRGDERPIRPMRDERGGLHQLTRCGVVKREDGLQVAPGSPRLSPGVAGPDKLAVDVESELTRNVQRVADAGHLRVVRLRRVDVRRIRPVGPRHTSVGASAAVKMAGSRQATFGSNAPTFNASSMS